VNFWEGGDPREGTRADAVDEDAMTREVFSDLKIVGVFPI
jgi:hypothetical protein